VGDAEPIVDLQRLLNGVYHRAAYHFRIDYTAAPRTARSETDAAWADVFFAGEEIDRTIEGCLNAMARICCKM
jgi:hypothetical protein